MYIIILFVLPQRSMHLGFLNARKMMSEFLYSFMMFGLCLNKDDVSIAWLGLT